MLKEKDFKFHNVTQEENDRLAKRAYAGYLKGVERAQKIERIIQMGGKDLTEIELDPETMLMIIQHLGTTDEKIILEFVEHAIADLCEMERKQRRGWRKFWPSRETKKK